MNQQDVLLLENMLKLKPKTRRDIVCAIINANIELWGEESVSKSFEQDGEFSKEEIPLLIDILYATKKLKKYQSRIEFKEDLIEFCRKEAPELVKQIEKL